MKTAAIFFGFCSCALFMDAQTAFEKAYGGSWNYGLPHYGAAKPDHDGGYIATGTFDASATSSYSVLAKTGMLGDTAWVKRFDNGVYVVTTDVETTSDHGYVLCGAIRQSAGSDLNLLVMKLDSTGNQEWTKFFGGTLDEMGNSVQEVPSGGYVVAGYTRSYGSGAKDIFLLRLDVNGNLSWAENIGGTANDQAFCVKNTSDQGFILAGSTESYGNAGGHSDLYLVKTNSTGAVSWSKTFGGVYNDTAYSVIQTSDSGYMVAGCLKQNNSDYNWYFVKTNSTGILQWQKSESASGWGTASGIIQTSDGGYAASGYWGSGVIFDCLLKMDATGNAEWGKLLTGKLYGENSTTSIDATNDGGYLVGSSPGAWLIKVDPGLFSSCIRDTLITMEVPAANSTSPNSAFSAVTPLTPANAFSTYEGANLTVDCSATSVSEMDVQNQAQVYPNPTSGIITITADGQKTISVYSMEGSLLKTFAGENESEKLTLDLSDLPNGVYMLQIRTGEKMAYRKIVLSK